MHMVHGDVLEFTRVLAGLYFLHHATQYRHVKFSNEIKLKVSIQLLRSSEITRADSKISTACCNSLRTRDVASFVTSSREFITNLSIKIPFERSEWRWEIVLGEGISPTGCRPKFHGRKRNVRVAGITARSENESGCGIRPYSSRICRRFTAANKLAFTQCSGFCNCIQCARAWNMGKRYAASITASPAMKVLYFRAVTRNLASDTRLTPRSPAVEWRFTLKLPEYRISCVYITHRAVPVSSGHWLERDLTAAALLLPLSLSLCLLSVPREFLFAPCEYEWPP